MLSKKYILLLLEWYDYRIHKGVAEIARENGWQLNCPKNPLNNIEFLKDWHGDGCIALLETDKAFDYFSKHQVPLVDLGLSDYDIEVQRVVTANEEIGKIAAEHFRDQGHRIIFTLSPGKTRMYEERLFHFKNYVEKDVADYMKQPNLEITIEINDGNKNFTCYTMDFTQKYISINSDYRS